jgi:hypothetical protein
MGGDHARDYTRDYSFDCKDDEWTMNGPLALRSISLLQGSTRMSHC